MEGLRGAFLRQPLTIAGHVDADMFWGRITYFSRSPVDFRWAKEYKRYGWRWSIRQDRVCSLRATRAWIRHHNARTAPATRVHSNRRHLKTPLTEMRSEFRHLPFVKVKASAQTPDGWKPGPAGGAARGRLPAASRVPPMLTPSPVTAAPLLGAPRPPVTARFLVTAMPG